MITKSTPLSKEVFSSLLELEIKRSLRYKNFVSLLLIETNPGIRNGNNAFSLPPLEKIIFLLRHEIRETDLIGAAMENLITLVLLYSDKVSAHKVAVRLHSCMRSYFASEINNSKAFLSLGGACFPTHATDSAGLLNTASAMLERAKTQGENSFYIME